MMYTMPKNLLSICVNFTLATQPKHGIFPNCPPALFFFRKMRYTGFTQTGKSTEKDTLP